MLSTVKIADPGRLADTIAAHLPVTIEEKQALLETVAVPDRLGEVERLLEAEIEKLRVDKKINNRVKKQMEKAQKEYYLNEKIKRSSRSWGARTSASTRSRSSGRRSNPPRCPTKPRTRPSRSSSASRSCRRFPPRRRSRAITSNGSSRCRGRRNPAS
jgi:ATP-dependent Lon protease